MRLVWVLVGVLVAWTPSPAADEEGFQPLLTAEAWSGWKAQLPANSDKDKTFLLKDSVLICTGKPLGYLYTEKSYSTYMLRYEWRYPRPADLKEDALFPGNSGVFLHIQGKPMIWPVCLEVQKLYRDAGNVFKIGRNVRFTSKIDKEKQKSALKPVGEWNASEIIVEAIQLSDGKPGTRVTSKLNGVEICVGEGALVQGPIGIQSENWEIHYRNMRIRPLK